MFMVLAFYAVNMGPKYAKQPKKLDVLIAATVLWSWQRLQALLEFKQGKAHRPKLV